MVLKIGLEVKKKKKRNTTKCYGLYTRNTCNNKDNLQMFSGHQHELSQQDYSIVQTLTILIVITPGNLLYRHFSLYKESKNTERQTIVHSYIIERRETWPRFIDILAHYVNATRQFK